VRDVLPEEIEARYQQSAFIKEICVFDSLYAVVVPDVGLMRAKRIVNIGDLLRFEMEGQSVHLPPHQRVRQYEIWFDALPRTAAGALQRLEIERRVTARRESQGAALAADEAQTREPHESVVLELLRSYSRGRRIHLDANLELDLGLDSMDRVELLTNLEQRLNIRFDDSKAHEILTVQQLLDASRPSEPPLSAASIERSWSVLLRPSALPDGAVLPKRRPIAAPIFFVVSRLLRVFLGPGIVHGRGNLPQHGPYIICPNHQGYLDPFIVCGALPYRVFRDLFFVGAAEYFETPAMRWLARMINLLPVDPDANLASAMRTSARGLREGRILMMFPEGERSIDGTVKRFKKGAPILAQHLGVPIVPVAIRGAFELWPRNRPINWRALLPFGYRVRVQFGSPMRFEASSDYGDSASRLRAAVEKMWAPI
jgi:long-chain acyl-CoA synthetase